MHRVMVGKRNRKTYPGPGVFEDAALSLTAGGRWTLRFSAYVRTEPAKPRRSRRRAHARQGSSA